MKQKHADPFFIRQYQQMSSLMHMRATTRMYLERHGYSEETIEEATKSLEEYERCSKKK